MTAMTARKIHVRDIKVGDVIWRDFMGRTAVVTATDFNYYSNRVYGHYEGEEWNPHLLENADCMFDLIEEQDRRGQY